MGQMQEGTLLKVQFETRLPVSATDDQINEWINFELNSGGLEEDNPLSDFSLETWSTSSLEWEDTGLVGRREEFDHMPTENGGVKWKVRYHRDPAVP